MPGDFGVLGFAGEETEAGGYRSVARSAVFWPPHKVKGDRGACPSFSQNRSGANFAGIVVEGVHQKVE